MLLVNNENHGRYINVRPEVGLLTSTTRTFIHEGVTTEYATQIVGTTLDNGRVYAQYLKKSSRVLYDSVISTPSVVTSWVGESLHSGSVILPQNHNELFDADQPNWQAIDDRLLIDRQDDVIGKTDIVELRRSPSMSLKLDGVKEVKTWLNSSANKNYEVHPNHAKIRALGENIQRVGVNKVLPFGDLPTYTIKQYYEPSAFLVPHGRKELEVDYDFGESVGRNPRLIYKQIMEVDSKDGNKSDLSYYSGAATSTNRHFATVTYYGFAEFTTVVGDSTIVFSPSTSPNHLHYNAHVTSIKGEATLGNVSPQGPSVSNVLITAAQDVDEHYTRYPSTTKVKQKMTTPTDTIESKYTEMKQTDSIHEFVNNIVRPTESEKSSTQATIVEEFVMLPQVSVEEICTSLNNTNTNAVESKITFELVTNETIAAPLTDSSNLQIFGGATTIFFEDDPFANFIVPSKTNIIKNSPSEFHSVSDEIFMDSLHLSKPNTKKLSATTKSVEFNQAKDKLIEITEDLREIETTTPRRSLDQDVSSTTIAPKSITKKLSQNVYDSPNIFSSVLIKEIDPQNFKDVPSDCISTSQVFLTQLPKTVTVFKTITTSVASATSELKTEIIKSIQPTFVIEEATKHYCIQASNIQRTQLENAVGFSNISIVSKETESDLKYNQENITESNTENSTERDIFEIKTARRESGTKPSDRENNEQEASSKLEYNGDEDEEIEVIYKTLYTTYTYLTTFFHDDSTSISSHTEVVTNIKTSTLDIIKEEFTAKSFIANPVENEVNPTNTLESIQMKSAIRFMVPSEIESFIRIDEEIHAESDIKSSVLNESISASKSLNTLVTFFTTYTYYTTIFADKETEVMSHTEVVRNVKKPTTSTILDVDINTIAIYPSQSAKKDANFSSIFQYESKKFNNTNAYHEIDSKSMLRSETATYSREISSFHNILDHYSINRKIINKNEAKSLSYEVPPKQSIFEDQISSESDTGVDEIVLSTTLLLQTSFTTFTYYTTMYSGDKTNVISHLETLTNTVVETLQSSRTIGLEGAIIPITYFTTFTYWTKLIRDGQLTTSSREETLSNVIMPTAIQKEIPSHTKRIYFKANRTLEVTSTTDASVHDKTTQQLPQKERKIILDNNSNTPRYTNLSNYTYRTNLLEPTTYFTTFTYYTTSYEMDKTITDSRFETITNIITPTITLTNTDDNMTGLVTLEPLHVASTPGIGHAQNNIDQFASNLVLYDFKKIIDADSVSTIFFTTEIKPIIKSDGLSAEIISSSSSLFINEERRKIQANAVKESLKSSLDSDDQSQKQYKTGLVRLIEGTRIANHTTTLYQSRVIGTIIDQRYAQIIESTSSFLFEKTKNPVDISGTNIFISLTTSSDIENIQATKVKSSVLESNSDQETEMVDEENNSKIDEKLRFPFQTKKSPFISSLKSFSNRNRAHFALKKNSSATIITRSDFTPTITATPALKSIIRVSSTRRLNASGITSSHSALLASSSKRFGRPSKTFRSGAGSHALSSLVAISSSGASRNRLASSSIGRGVIASSTRRLSGSVTTTKPSYLRSSLFPSAFPGNSRLRAKPTATADLGEILSTVDISELVNSNSQEERISQGGSDNDEENATGINRRQNNPLLRLRRPLNRPKGFSLVRSQPNSANNAVTLRSKPLISRTRNTTSVVSTKTTTTKPKLRTFQPSHIPQNRIRTANSLFPPRNIFGIKKPTATAIKNRDLSEVDNDDSEYDDEDDGELESDDEEENSRRRRSSNKIDQIEKKKSRRKREAENSEQNRKSFHNRFRRPKLISTLQTDPKSLENYAMETNEAIITGGYTATSTQRIRSRFGSRYSSSSLPTATTSTETSLNKKPIRPTRPTNNNGGRPQFTLHEKNISQMSTMQKGLNYVKRPAFRRPQPGANISSRRIPTSTVSSPLTSGKRRLKTYTSNDLTTTSRNSVTGRSHTTLSSRSRSNGLSREANIGNRNRGRNSHKYSTKEDTFLIDNSGTITVTHIITAEVTIPVINGKITKYKQVFTARTSTEVLGPLQYTTNIAADGVTQLVLTKEDSLVNYNGATEVTKYILHETPTTTITFTPTTIRRRKTSFSHVLSSTVYSVERLVSTVQPQISANAPLANILLSQLLLGNVGLPAGNPLLGALGGALTQPGVGLGTAVAQSQLGTPVTEYRTHASTYVTTVFEGQSTVLPVTFQGKKILTTVFDTTSQTVTATEFITDTIVTTPTLMAQAHPVVNSLILQQLLLQQHLQQQVQQSTPQSIYPLNAVFMSISSQFSLTGDNLQELEVSNNIRGSDHDDLINNEDDFAVRSSIELDEIALQAQPQKNGRKKPRKNNKSNKRKNVNNVESHRIVESSIITLYVSGRRPGEFSTVLSTVQVQPDSTQYKRHAHTIDSINDFFGDNEEVEDKYLGLPPEIILLDAEYKNEEKIRYLRKNNTASFATQSLESIVGDVSLWYATHSTTTNTRALKIVRPSIDIKNKLQSYEIEESPGLNINDIHMNSSYQNFFA